MTTSLGRIRSVVKTEIYQSKLQRLIENQEWATEVLENLHRVLSTNMAELGWPVRDRPDCFSRPLRVGPDRDLKVVYRIEEYRVVLIDVWEIPQPNPSNFA